MAWANATDTYSSDYDGFRQNKGVNAQYQWLGPKPGQRLYRNAQRLLDWVTPRHRDLTPGELSRT